MAREPVRVIMIRVTASQHAEIAEYAWRERMSMNELIRQAVTRHIASIKRKETRIENTRRRGPKTEDDEDE